MTSQGGGGGGAPTGTAGGVLGGTYPSPTFATNGTTPLLGFLSAALGADVPMSVAGTWYDVGTVVLGPGTWLIFAVATLSGGSNGGGATIRVWDGVSTSYGSAETFVTVSWIAVLPAICTVVVASGTTTIHVSVTSTSTTSTLKAAALQNGVGNNASQFFAVRVA